MAENPLNSKQVSRGSARGAMLALVGCVALSLGAGTAATAGSAADDGRLVVAQSTAGLPVRAGSWGGKVRAGPGQQYQHIDGLSEGEDVMLLENTGVMMGDYPWFKIQFKNGRVGYKWGGILCAKGVPVQGIFQSCPGWENTNQQGNTTQVTPTATTVNYSCEEGIPLIVRYENTAETSIAFFSHDSFPEVRLDQVVSGSGSRYSNGYYTLSAKGADAILEWEGTQSFCREVN